MSPQDKPRKDSQDSATQPSSAAEPDKAAGVAEPTKPGIKYVFKIAPADPKRNSIDFEDVADK